MGDTALNTLYYSVSIFTIIVDFICAHWCFAERKKSANFFAMTSVGAALVQIFYVISCVSENYYLTSISASMYFLSVSFTVFALFSFVLLYSKPEDYNIKRTTFRLVHLWFLADTVIMLINPFTEIAVGFDKSNLSVAHFAFTIKPLFWVHLLFSYVLLVFVVVMLVNKSKNTPSVYRRKYSYTLAAVFVVVIANALFLFYPQTFGENRLDFSIWGYSIAATLVYWLCFKYPYSGMKNYYHSWVVDYVDQGVVLFNYEDNLIIANDNVRKMFPECDMKDGLSLKEFTDAIGITLKHERKYDDYTFQFYIERDGQSIPIRFDHHCLRNNKGEVLGQFLGFTDDIGDVDLLTSYYTWNNFVRTYKEHPELMDEAKNVVVCDINGLADINAVHGRNVGDQAIILLSNLLREHFSGEHYFIRNQEASLIVISFSLEEDEIIAEIAEIEEEINKKNTLPCEIHIQSAISQIDSVNNDLIDRIGQAFKSLKNKKLLDIDSQKSELIRSLVKTLEECDNTTEAHVKRTQILGAELGKRLGLSDVQLSDLALLCILHDIGKIGIPLEILNKPSKLNDSEWRMMKTHTEKGYQIAISSKELYDIADMIKHHHECWNGKGYPDGLSQEAIPLLSRIIAVVDAYDAMTNDRPYRRAMSVEAAKKELKRCAGTQFDPSIVTEFVNLLPDDESIDIETTTASDSSIAATTEIMKSVVPTARTLSNVHQVTYSKYTLDYDGKIIDVDSEFEKLTGYSKEDVKAIGLTQADLIPEDDLTEYLRLSNEQLARSGHAYFEHRIKRKDGTVFYVYCYGALYYDSAEMAGKSEIIIVDSASTHAMQVMLNEDNVKSQARLENWESKYRCDSLTGLLSQDAFRSDVEMELIGDEYRIMMLLLDVDKFREFNDSFGHKAGDEFLIHLSQTLTATLRKDDLACRMGGDEFAAALLFKKDCTEEKMLERAQQICDKMIFMLSSENNGTSISMGVSISSSVDNTFTKLYDKADKALFEAKNGGRGRMVAAE